MPPVGKNGRIVVTALGGPDVLRYVEEDIPQPGPGEVLVKVMAAGVAYADVLMRRGLYPRTPEPPFTPGYDLVGEIVAFGKDVTTPFRAGQRVGALTVRGSYSRFANVPAEFLVPVPETLDPAEAVCLILNYVTAHQMLHRVAKVSPGNSILIHGAAGGVGTALLQLGALHGLTMYGTASTAKQSAIASAGGIPIDYKTENVSRRLSELEPGGVQAIFDPVGGINWWRSYLLLRRAGTLVCYGVSSAVTQGKMAAGGKLCAPGNAETDSRRTPVCLVQRHKFKKSASRVVSSGLDSPSGFAVPAKDSARGRLSASASRSRKSKRMDRASQIHRQNRAPLPGVTRNLSGKSSPARTFPAERGMKTGLALL